MATIAENLQKIVDIKQDIKIAIENKGVDMTNTPFSEYSTKIDEISSGGGDTTTYSYKTPTADVEGLKALGWDDESIGYFRDNNLCYDWQKDEYIVTEGNKELYGVVTKDNISTYKSDPNFVYCPMIDTSNVTYMGSMFNGCSSLQSIPLLNTSNVTNMYYMFDYCSTLQSIPPIDTSNVTKMGYMFDNCSSLQSIPLLNCGNATNMDSMFHNCSSLQSIPEIDTSNVTIMSYMFQNCSSLQSIPLLNTSNVTDMNRIFYGCSFLTTIPEINTSNVTDMGYMFYNCSSLTTIPQLDTSNVTNMGSMLYGCSKLVSLPKFNVPKVNAINNMFGYSNIATLTDVGGWENLKLSWNDSNGLTRLPNLTYDSCINILNGLYDFVGNGETPDSAYGKLKVNSKFLTTVTEEDLATATAKGWTITA